MEQEFRLAFMGFPYVFTSEGEGGHKLSSSSNRN